MVKGHFLARFFKSFLDESRLTHNGPVAHCIFLVMGWFLAISPAYGLNI